MHGVTTTTPVEPAPHAEAPTPTSSPTSAGDGSAVNYLDPPKSIRRFVFDAWHNRQLVGPLGRHMIARMYSKTYLGRAWTVVRPAMDAAGGAILFGGVLSVTSRDGTPYLLFFTAGILGWRAFERTVIWVTRSFDRVRVTSKIDFPLLLVPICGGFPVMIDLAVYLAVFLIAALGYLAIDGHLWLALSPQTLAAVGGLGLCLTFGLALGLCTSVVNARARDIKYVIRYVLQIGLFVTPVIYPITRLPAGLRPFAQANPMTAPIELIKYGLLGSGDVQLVPVVWSCAVAVLSLAAGLWFFSRRASNFVGPAGWDGDDDEEDLL